MKYVLLLHLPTVDGEVSDDTSPAPDPVDVMQAYAALKQELQAEGVWLGGQALQPAAITTQVRVRDREVLVVDGPLVETAEQVAGYYLVDCRDLEEAVAIAARIPGAVEGTVEVRPVFEYEQLLADSDLV